MKLFDIIYYIRSFFKGNSVGVGFLHFFAGVFIYRIRNYYYKLGGILIIKPFMVYFILFLLFCIKYAIYYILITNEISNSLNSVSYLNLPSINTIRDYFKYNTSIGVNLNFIQYLKVFQKPKVIENDDPMDPVSNFFVSMVLETISEYISTSVNHLINEYSESTNNQQPLEPQEPQFIIDTPFTETIVLEKDILDRNLPFEAPIEIVVPDDSLKTQIEVYVPPIESLEINNLTSMYSPAVYGPRIYSDDYIFDFHISIIDLINQKINAFNIIEKDDSIRFIRDEVHKYLVQSQIFTGLTAADLQNSNHFLNLLIREMVINNMLVDDREQFILSNICGAIIIETICHIQQLPLSDFYNDPDVYRQTIDTIIIRFIPQ